MKSSYLVNVYLNWWFKHKSEFLGKSIFQIIGRCDVLQEIPVNHSTWDSLIIFPTDCIVHNTDIPHGHSIVMWTWFVRQTRIRITDTPIRFHLIFLVRNTLAIELFFHRNFKRNFSSNIFNIYLSYSNSGNPLALRQEADHGSVVRDWKNVL